MWPIICGILLMAGVFQGGAVVLWSDFGATLVHETGPGTDILGGAVKRDDSSGDTLYFKFHVDPLSDATTEEYFAAFQLFEGDEGRLAIGNSLKAWAYSAFNTSETGESNNIFGDFDFHSSRPESSGLGTFFNYELPRRGIERTIVFRVQYNPGGNDRVTVWLNPDLAIGATEENQTNALTTRFRANASFNEIRLRHGGGGGGWTFSDMAIATSFSDFIAGRNVETSEAMRIGFQTWQHGSGSKGCRRIRFVRWNKRETVTFGLATTTGWRGSMECGSFPSECARAYGADQSVNCSRTDTERFGSERSAAV
jgi:hypothetical protein